jgi:hypothetical protein
LLEFRVLVTIKALNEILELKFEVKKIPEETVKTERRKVTRNGRYSYEDSCNFSLRLILVR